MAAGPTQSYFDGQRVFISYRRRDCQAQANGLHDGLCNRLKAASIFMDIDSIPPGVDFEQHIRAEIQVCDVVLVMIGDDWLNAASDDGGRRIDEPEDFVRLEIESALASDRVQVIPVLVEGAQMPRATDLPESIRRLARINAIELNDRRWISDIERLAKLIETMGEKTHPKAKPDIPPAQPMMRVADVKGTAVAEAIGKMPGRFQTRDVSDHLAVVQAHGAMTRAPNYHSMIGTFMSSNAAGLAVRSYGPGTNGRGELWERVAAGPQQAPPAAHHPPGPAGVVAVPGAGPAHGPGPGHYAPPPQPSAQAGSSFNFAWLLVPLPLFTCGFLSWVPAVVAAARTKDDAGSRYRSYAVAVVCAASAVTGFVLLGGAPEDATGTPVGIGSNIGLGLLGLSIIAGTWIAITHRNKGQSPPAQQQMAQLPGVGEALAKRQARQQYRQMALRDPGLAREISVGRPDIQRTYDDGGLLDVNSISAVGLSQFGNMTPPEAQSIVAARDRFGRLSSIDDLIVHANLHPRTVEHMREHAIFV